MSKLQALECVKCGGHIDRATMTCKFCGIQYRLDDNFIPVMIAKIDPRMETINAKCFVGNEVFMARNADDVVANAIKRTLVEKIAHELENYVDIISEDDPLHCGKNFHARLRIYKPDYRFGDIY